MPCPPPTTDPERALARELGAPVAGVDEAGRGAWAGPVVAAAVIVDPDCVIEGVRDSKEIPEPKRESLFDIIMGCAVVGVGIAEVAEIDRPDMGVGKATYLAMARAVTALPLRARAVLVDGNVAPPFAGAGSRCLVRGDSLSLSIAAASIIAKVTRDRIMRALHPAFPAFCWQSNKGYPAPVHRNALATHGVSAHHRRSFAPIRALLGEARPAERAVG